MGYRGNQVERLVDGQGLGEGRDLSLPEGLDGGHGLEQFERGVSIIGKREEANEGALAKLVKNFGMHVEQNDVAVLRIHAPFEVDEQAQAGAREQLDSTKVQGYFGFDPSAKDFQDHVAPGARPTPQAPPGFPRSQGRRLPRRR